MTHFYFYFFLFIFIFKTEIQKRVNISANVYHWFVFLPSKYMYKVEISFCRKCSLYAELLKYINRWYVHVCMYVQSNTTVTYTCTIIFNTEVLKKMSQRVSKQTVKNEMLTVSFEHQVERAFWKDILYYSKPNVI